MNEPILSKRPPHRYDYKPMTWGRFINLRKWAEKFVEEFGYPVYLVGSTLEKEVPRDFDISVIIPLEDYEKMYGKIPESQEGKCQLLTDVFLKDGNVKHYFECREALGEEADLDLKFCPDTWWPEKPKLLLAGPKNN